MSTAAIIRICGYVIGVGSMLTGQIISALISPYGASQNTVTHVLAIVGSFVTLATLIKGVIDTMIPQGYSNVITPSTPAPPAAAASSVGGVLLPAPAADPTSSPVLTTPEAVKKGP